MVLKWQLLSWTTEGHINNIFAKKQSLDEMKNQELRVKYTRGQMFKLGAFHGSICPYRSPFVLTSSTELIELIYPNLYGSLWFWTKDTTEPRWPYRPLRCWFPMILRPKEVVFYDLLFLFMPSPWRYGHKREGHSCIEKGINMIVSII